MKLISVFLFLFLTGCTFSLTTIHTQGAASDVVDEVQKADPVVSTSLQVPVKPL